MTSPAGWYPDPGGQRGMFRYWDGSTWSAQLSPTPGGAGPAMGPSGPQPYAGQPGTKPATKRSAGPWIALVAVIVVVALIAWLVITFAGGGGLTNPGAPGQNPTTNPCPTQKEDIQVDHPNDGRVHGGQLSYPTLGDPWLPQSQETRVPFGRDVNTQYIVIESNYNGLGNSWVASVLVGELVAGDGFYTPQEGSEIVVKCLIGAFYGGAEVTRDDKVSRAATVDGKDAWLTETHLSFDIEGLQAKGETAIVMIVATSPEASSIFYASIPDNAQEYLPDARNAMAALKVGP